jgi:hypothetical protein
LKFPGYQVVTAEDGSITIRRIELDETELTPESNWMEGYSNTDPEEGLWLGRDLDAALNEVRRRLST